MLNESVILMRIKKIQNAVDNNLINVTDKEKKLDTLKNLTNIVRKKLSDRVLEPKEYKALADFFINIVPELCENDVMQKLITHIKKRKPQKFL